MNTIKEMSIQIQIDNCFFLRKFLKSWSSFLTVLALKSIYHQKQRSASEIFIFKKCKLCLLVHIASLYTYIIRQIKLVKNMQQTSTANIFALIQVFIYFIFFVLIFIFMYLFYGGGGICVAERRFVQITSCLD